MLDYNTRDAGKSKSKRDYELLVVPTGPYTSPGHSHNTNFGLSLAPDQALDSHMSTSSNKGQDWWILLQHTPAVYSIGCETGLIIQFITHHSHKSLSKSSSSNQHSSGFKVITLLFVLWFPRVATPAICCWWFIHLFQNLFNSTTSKFVVGVSIHSNHNPRVSLFNSNIQLLHSF